MGALYFYILLSLSIYRFFILSIDKSIILFIYLTIHQTREPLSVLLKMYDGD